MNKQLGIAVTALGLFALTGTAQAVHKAVDPGPIQHPDDLKSVAAATLAKHLPTIKAVQAAAARVLAGKEVK